MTPEQATQVTSYIADLLAISQFQALSILFFCGLAVAGFLAIIVLEGLK